MAGADVGGEGGGGNSKHKKKHGKKRIGVRVDMTPMVDVAFLLLTFFMLTTVMRKQETLEINLPPNNKTKINIAESNLLTMYVAQNDSVFYSNGVQKPQPIAYNTLENFFKKRAAENSKLVILLKLNRQARFHMLVNLIDKLNLADLQRFSIAPMTANDIKLLSKASS